MCNQWVMVDGTEFGEKEIVKKNFQSAFLELFPKDLGAEKLEDFDFRHIREHVERTHELNKQKTTE